MIFEYWLFNCDRLVQWFSSFLGMPTFYCSTIQLMKQCSNFSVTQTLISCQKSPAPHSFTGTLLSTWLMSSPAPFSCLNSPITCHHLRDVFVHFLSATLDYKVYEERQFVSLVHCCVPSVYSYWCIVGARKIFDEWFSTSLKKYSQFSSHKRFKIGYYKNHITFDYIAWEIFTFLVVYLKPSCRINALINMFFIYSLCSNDFINSITWMSVPYWIHTCILSNNIIVCEFQLL